jgi:heptaprenyl diphosphate synthase
MPETRIAKAVMPWADHFSDDSLDDSISAGLADVEDLLWLSIRSDLPLLTETSSHLISAGGKRFRPMLSLLSAHFGDPSRDEVVQAATACELIHLATLYHDDVMDEAKLRRGVESANARWANNIAIIAGDFLFAAASKLTSVLGGFIIDLHAETSKRLVTGQLREMVGWSPGLSPEAHYMKLISDKTASLMASSCQTGARMAGCSDDEVAILGRYAEELGLAFQLSDDVLDIVGGPALGKSAGSDLREGVMTLPVIYAREASGPDDGRLLELLDGDLSDAGDKLVEALGLLAKHPAMDRCRDAVREHVTLAIEALDALPDIPAKSALRAVARSMETRSC